MEGIDQGKEQLERSRKGANEKKKMEKGIEETEGSGYDRTICSDSIIEMVIYTGDIHLKENRLNINIGFCS